MSLLQGQIVIHTAAPERGLAKLHALYRNEARLLYMDSIADWQEVTVPRSEVEAVTPWPQNRVYVRDQASWRMGRITHLRTDSSDGFEIRFPNDVCQVIPEEQVYLRASGDPLPMEVLKIHGHETPYFFERRWPLIEAFQQQLRASRGLTSLLSSAVDLRDHQINAVRRVLQDSVPRYLLADEVGLGKTIEAGLILRQMLLDQPGLKVTCLVPPQLVKQWSEELRRRFYIDDFPGAVTILPHHHKDLPASDLIIIDEAHHLAAKAFTDQKREYQRVAAWTARATALLLLSATPAAADQQAFLGMLHLLEPQVYALNDTEAFALRLREREQIASLFFALDAELPKSMLDDSVREAGELLPADAHIQTLLKAWWALPADADEAAVRRVVTPLRLHISETYRLHRRMIRHRRAVHAQNLVRGRQQGPNLTLEDPEAQTAWEFLDQFRQNLALLAEQQDHRDWVLAVTEELIEGATAGLMTWRSTLTLLAQHAQLKQFPHLLADLKQIERALPEHDQLPEVLEKTVRQSLGKVVIFTTHAEQARDVSLQLAQRLGAARVALNLDGDTAVQRFIKEAGCQVLVADATGEEGLNLQCADLLIHLNLPVNPNRLEQRLGRLDRYGRGDPVISRLVNRTSFPAALQDYFAFQRALGVFDQSVASLQYLLDEVRQEGLLAFLEGDYALKTLRDQLTARIQAEQERVEMSEMLDTIDEERDNDLTSLMDDLYDSEAVDFGKAFSRWVVNTLNFRPHYAGDLIQLNFDDRRTLVNWERINQDFKPLLGRQGTFRRKIAQQGEAHLLRLGDPFVNAISDYLAKDDRGRSYAFWRVCPQWTDQPLIAFALHFMVMPDPEPVRQVAAKYHLNPEAVTRQLAGLLGPRTFTIYLDQQAAPLTADAQKLVAQPYSEKLDYNLSNLRVHALEALLPQRAWEETCDRVHAEAIAKLQQDAELQEYLKKTTQAAKDKLSAAMQQLQVRHQAGRPDVTQQHLKREQALHTALLKGISSPKYHLDAVGVRVLSSKDPFQ